MDNGRVVEESKSDARAAEGGVENHRRQGDCKRGGLGEYELLESSAQESLRLHSPGPLIIPHESTEDIKINGYDICSGTRVVVNVWAISRSPIYWKDPETFYPERFLNSGIDYYKGHDLQFIPFGAGRRMCPGMAFTSANSELAMANLLHRFNWSLPQGVTGESLDMTESPGITVHKKLPLLVVPSPRIH